MRTLLALLLTLCTICPALAAEDAWIGPLTREEFNLIGPVSELKETFSTVNNSVAAAHNQTIWTFDRAGALLTTEVYKRDGLEQRRTCQWDPSHRTLTLLTLENKAVDRSQHFLEEIARQVCDFDAAGRLIGSQWLNTQGVTASLQRDLDAQGRLLQESKADKKGQVQFLKVQVWDDRAKTREEEIFGLQGQIVTPQSGHDEHRVVTFDADGRQQQAVVESSTKAGIKTTVTYQYDEAGRLVREKAQTSIGSSETSSFTYDAEGNILQRAFVSSKGTSQTHDYQYRYDERGNWIWRRMKETTTLPRNETLPIREEITTRVFAYFPER